MKCRQGSGRIGNEATRSLPLARATRWSLMQEGVFLREQQRQFSSQDNSVGARIPGRRQQTRPVVDSQHSWSSRRHGWRRRMIPATRTTARWRYWELQNIRRSKRQIGRCRLGEVAFTDVNIIAATCRGDRCVKREQSQENESRKQPITGPRPVLLRW